MHKTVHRQIRNWNKNMKTKISSGHFRTLLILLAITGIASLPLAKNALIAGRDLQVSLSKTETILQNLGNVFPLRLLPCTTLDYGYEAASFQSDLFYLIPVLFRMSGLGPEAAFKLSLLLANAACALVAYLCFRSCFGQENIGLTGSMLFTWCPYRINEIYGNGNLGETFGWCFLPIVLSSLTELTAEDMDPKQAAPLCRRLALGFSLLLLASTSLCFVTAVMATLFFLFMGRKHRCRGLFPAAAGTAALFCLANLWFLLPGGLALRDAAAAGTVLPADISQESIYLQHYLSVFLWGGSNVSLEQGMMNVQALCPGAAGMLLLLFWLWSRYTGKSENHKSDLVVRRMLFVCVPLMIFSSNLFPWYLFQNKNRLFSILLSFFRSPIKWGAPACALLIAAACCFLSGRKEKEPELCRRLLFPAAVSVSLGTTLLLLRNMVTHRNFVNPEADGYPWIPFQILVGESGAFRICELISAAVWVACLTASLVRRFQHAEKI